MMANCMSFIVYHADAFQGVTEMVFDRLPKSSRVDFVTDISRLKTQLSYFGEQRRTLKYF